MFSDPEHLQLDVVGDSMGAQFNAPDAIVARLVTATHILLATQHGQLAAFDLRSIDTLLSRMDQTGDLSEWQLRPGGLTATGLNGPRALLLDVDLGSAAASTATKDVLWVISETEAVSLPLSAACMGASPQEMQRWTYPRPGVTVGGAITRQPRHWVPLFDDAASPAYGAASEPSLHIAGASPMLARCDIPAARLGPSTSLVSAVASSVTATAAAVMRVVSGFSGSMPEAVQSRVSTAAAAPLSMLSRWFSAQAQPQPAIAGPEQLDSASANAPPLLSPPRHLEHDVEWSEGSSDRCVTQVLADPTGQLVAVATNNGRVMLVQATDMTVLRLWKGYRQAQLAFIEPQGVGTGGSSSLSDNGLPAAHPQCAHLLIYSASRGTLDAWPLRFGPATSSLRVARHGKLVYHPSHTSPEGDHRPMRCFLLHQRRPEPSVSKSAGDDAKSGAAGLGQSMRNLGVVAPVPASDAGGDEDQHVVEVEVNEITL